MKIVHVEDVGMDMILNKPTRCRRCNAVIYFTMFPNGGWIPVCQNEHGVWINHFSNCPYADEFRPAKIINEDMA